MTFFCGTEKIFLESLSGNQNGLVYQRSLKCILIDRQQDIYLFVFQRKKVKQVCT